MKPILLIATFLFFSFISFSQNWKGVVFPDTTYYTVGSNSFDSSWKGLLRCAWIRSISMSGADSIFNFNYSVHVPQPMIGFMLDTMGSSWLGNFCIRKPDGTECYFNTLGDTIEIKTFANMSDTWKMVTDSNNTDFYATVINSYVTMVDGAYDSVKEFTIQAWQSGIMVSNDYNNTVIKLSKSHGFLATLQWEDFPFMYPGSDQVHPHLKFVHNRVDVSVKNTDFNNIVFSDRFALGNEWIIRSAFGYGNFDSLPLPSHDEYSGQITTTHDSVISSSIIAPGQIEVTCQRNQHILHKSYSYNVSLGTFQYLQTTSVNTFTHVDTFLQPVNPRFLKPYFCTDLFNLNPLHATTYNQTSYAIDSVCHYPRLRIRSSSPAFQYSGGNWILLFSVSGAQFSGENFLAGIGLNEGYSQTLDVSYYLTFNSSSSLLFLKTDSCTYLNKFNVLALSAHDLTENLSSIIVYPNPSASVIFISNTDLSNKINSLTISDIAGREMHDIKLVNDKMDISQLKAGIYFFEINTTKGKTIRRIVKE